MNVTSLNQHPRPVERVDGAEVVFVLVVPVGEDLLDGDIQFVGGALDRKVVHVVGDHCRHLTLLRNVQVGYQDVAEGSSTKEQPR